MPTNTKEYHRQWRLDNAAKWNAYKKEWTAANATKVKVQTKNRSLIYSYGITLDRYNEMFIKQNGCCDICGKHQSEFKRALNVDHDHDTEKIRGLLCDNCNRGLGIFMEDVTIFKKAIDYINKHKTSQNN